jgi:hypothetical protein
VGTTAHNNVGCKRMPTTTTLPPRGLPYRTVFNISAGEQW